MSGRKQHYIPQFLLRSFGEASSGKKLQVRVFTPDRQFLVPTDGIAAQREFYSEINNAEVTLDDVITFAEGEYVAIFNTLLEVSPGKLREGRDVARLLVHLGTRGNHLRASTATAGSYALRRATQLFADESYVRRIMGVGRSEPPPSVKKILDNAYNERQPLLRKARLSRHEFRKEMFAEMNRRWDEINDETSLTISALFGILDVQRLVYEAHNKVLSNDLEPENRVNVLQSMDWQIREWDQPVFVLPDAVALAHDAERAAMPAMFVGPDEIQGIIFPLSPTRAVCSGVYNGDLVLQTLIPNFAMFAAKAAWEFVVAPPSYGDRAVIGEVIGASVGSLVYDNIEKAIEESIIESFGVQSHDRV